MRQPMPDVAHEEPTISHKENMRRSFIIIYGHSKIGKPLFTFISIGFHNSVMMMLYLSYCAILDHKKDFPYLNSEKLNLKMANVIYGLGFCYCFGHIIFVNLILIVLMLSEKPSFKDIIRWLLLIIMSFFELQFPFFILFAGFEKLNSIARWTELEIASFLPKAVFQFFMYICLIPFISMSFSQQNDKSVQFFDEYSYLRICIILLSIKIFVDLFYAIWMQSDK